MTSQNMMNGVDLDALTETINAITSDADIAAFRFNLDNEWRDAGLNVSTVRTYYGAKQDFEHATTFELTNDEPPILLSGDEGPNPVENLLHALAGCLTTSLVYHAAANGIPVKGVRTRFEGDLDLRGFLGLSNDVRRGFSQIRAVFEIDGDLTAEQKQELVELGRKYSPVFDIVTNGTPVDCVVAETAAAAA